MFTTSEAAEAAFYAAFSAADADAMMLVWAHDRPVCCIHPGGPRLESLASIQHSWELILGEPVARRFELRGRIITGHESLRVHLLEENITVPGTRFVAPPVLATNIYAYVDDSWRMIVHHGGVAPEQLSEADVINPEAAPRLH